MFHISSTLRFTPESIWFANVIAVWVQLHSSSYYLGSFNTHSGSIWGCLSYPRRERNNRRRNTKKTFSTMSKSLNVVFVTRSEQSVSAGGAMKVSYQPLETSLNVWNISFVLGLFNLSFLERFYFGLPRFNNV